MATKNNIYSVFGFIAITNEPMELNQIKLCMGIKPRNGS
jgi:hypothetical protein